MTLGLWLTDSLHGVSPAWVGLVAACLCLLPRVGFVSSDEFGQEVSHRTAVYVAAILGLAALVGQSGLGAFIGNEVLAMAPLDPSSPFSSYVLIVGFSSVLNFVVTANGVPALFTPLAQSLATASGLPLLSVLMIQVIGFSTPLLPYQASPIVLAIEMGRIPFMAALRLSLALALITFVVLVPINYGWFVFLGWLP
jgi:di/tricarboxylate transporter